ncbi:MAG: 4-hydroxy-tetrahydrodipicolinate synthase [Rikenellaceae bacterium]|jgi:4-hydroxy-tetrahydrodipicolinate synthase|nr:4-hydroxy-tetrahydrodipicolinate synthase [Rikenellaceae bacterium]
MEKKIKGVGVALVTPFAESGEVDFGALDRLVDSVVAGGVDFLVALGTTAETPTLTHAERRAVAEAIVRRNAGRVPVVIGMGGNDTAGLCQQLREFDPTGFAGVLSVTPYYNKPTQEGLYRHFKAVAEASPLPVILYNVPGRTGVNMSAATTLRIARDCPNVCAVKEACGDIRQMEELVAGAPEGFAVLSGDDALTLPLISVGGDGIISVVANAFPEKFSTVVHTAISGSVARAEGLWADFEGLCPLLFEEGNPAGIKGALSVRGICRPDVRLPLVAASPSLLSRLASLILK